MVVKPLSPFVSETVKLNTPFVPAGVPCVPATADLKPLMVMSAAVTEIPVALMPGRVLIYVTNHAFTAASVFAVAWGTE